MLLIKQITKAIIAQAVMMSTHTFATQNSNSIAALEATYPGYKVTILKPARILFIPKIRGNKNANKDSKTASGSENKTSGTSAAAKTSKPSTSTLIKEPARIMLTKKPTEKPVVSFFDRVPRVVLTPPKPEDQPKLLTIKELKQKLATSK